MNSETIQTLLQKKLKEIKSSMNVIKINIEDKKEQIKMYEKHLKNLEGHEIEIIKAIQNTNE